MSLVSRVSIAFLVALALALGGFSASLYYIAGLRLRLALDQELEATLDHFPDGPEGVNGRVTWAQYDDKGHRVEGVTGFGRRMVLDGKDLAPIAVDVATTIEASDGLRWRVLAQDRRRTSRPRSTRRRRQRTSPWTVSEGRSPRQSRVARPPRSRIGCMGAA